MKHHTVPNESKGFQPQASRDLTYRLIAGSFSLEPMRIIRERTVAWGFWNVTFYLLGASHAMRFSRGRRQVTELLSCSTAPNAGSIALQVDVGQSPSMIATLRDLRVEVALTSLPIANTKLEPFERRFDDEDWLEHAFPNQDIDEPSWTRLRWMITPSNVRLETIHTYPHEGVCVHGVTDVSEIKRSNQEAAG